MQKVCQEEIAAILQYLSKDLGNCIYLYIDISKYGLDNPNMELWVEKEGNRYNLVVMKYFDSLQIYATDENWNSVEIERLIIEEKIRMISAPIHIATQLMSIASVSERYKRTDGLVYQYDNIKPISNELLRRKNICVELAQNEDMEEIAKLICSDMCFAENYDLDKLTQQLLERAQTGMGRNYIIREKGEIVAHIATYAEENQIAVASGLIVNNPYRAKMYGIIIENYLVTKLVQENIKVFTFVTDANRIKYLSYLKAKQCGDYSKLTLFR